MPLRYSRLADIPELSRFSSEQLKAMQRRLRKQCFYHWETWAADVTLAALSLLITFLERTFNSSTAVVVIGSVALAFVCGHLSKRVRIYVLWRYHRDEILSALRA